MSTKTHAAAVAFIPLAVAWPPIQAIRRQEQRKKVTMDVEFSGAYNERPAEALFAQRCLMVSFEDRELLDNDSYARIKALGRTYRGRQAWPEFRDYIPGSLPRRLEPPQVRYPADLRRGPALQGRRGVSARAGRGPDAAARVCGRRVEGALAPA